MDIPMDMKKKLLELSGISDMKDLESIIRDANSQIDEEKGYIKEIKKVINKPGVFDELVFEKVWDLFLTEYPNIKNYYEEVSKVDQNKSIQKSIDLRNKGNELYKKKKLQKAIDIYSEAIEAIPPIEEGSEALALSMANRSAAFYEQKSFNESLRDIDAALYLNYPPSKKCKLYERKAKILSEFGANNSAQIEYDKAIKNIESHGGTISDELRQAMDSISSDENPPVSSFEEEYIKPKVHINNLGNERFPQLRKGIRVIYNETKGRHCIAENEIQAGELVLCEEPIVAYLHPEFRSRNCAACFKSLKKFFIPSFSNSNRYCSLTCLKEETHLHDFWKAHDIIGEDNTLNIHLVLKAIQSHDPSFYQDVIKSTNYLFGSDGSQDFSSYTQKHQYQTIFNLVDHPNDRELEEECRLYARAVLSIRLLRDSEYLKTKNSTESVSNEEMAVAKCIYKLNTGFKYNLHSIHKVSDNTSTLSANKCVPLTDIGSGIFPTLLFLNHSCNSNTYRFNQGKRVYIYSKRKIFPGEEITDCYGIHHFSMPYQERQTNLLKGYRFNCECQACVSKLPLFHELKRLKLSGINENDIKEKISVIKSLSEKQLYEKAAHESGVLLRNVFESLEGEENKPDKVTEHVALVFCYSQWIFLDKQMEL